MNGDKIISMSFESFWQIISYFGDVQFWIGLTVAVLIIYQLIDKHDRRKVAWVLLALLPAIIISSQIVMVMKGALAVPRPCAGLDGCPSDYSFPSGHAAVVFAFATVVSIEMERKRLYLFAVPLAVMVALSRIFLNYHTLMDITAGAFIGIFVGYLFHKSYKTIHIYLEEKKVIA